MNYECYCALCSGPLVTSSLRGTEEYTYNQDLIKQETTRWIADVRCLGLNFKSTDHDKAFLSGPSFWIDDEEIRVRRGSDPKQHKKGKFSCYLQDNFNDWEVVYPFHVACLKILTKVLAHVAGVDSVNKDYLYEVMEQLAGEDCYSALPIDYGDIRGPDQFWSCTAGEEYTVLDPITISAFTPAIIKTSIQQDGLGPTAELFHNTAPDMETSTSFDRLPVEILADIACDLSIQDCLNFGLVTKSAHSLTHENRFWAQFIRRNMGWAWEVSDVLNDLLHAGQDLRSLCLWLDQISTPNGNQTTKYLQLINRRRIWGTFNRIVASYMKLADREASRDATSAFRDSCICLGLHQVSFIEPEGETKVCEQVWITNPCEMENRSATFDVFWNEDGALVGLQVSIGSSQRLLGMDQSLDSQLERTSARIQAGAWVNGLMVYTDEDNKFVSGIEVLCPDGDKCLGESRNTMTRLLAPSYERRVVGMVAEIADTGVITRMGLIEYPANDSIQGAGHLDSMPSLPNPILWSSRVGSINVTDGYPVSKKAVPSVIGSGTELVPFSASASSGTPRLADISPHEILWWHSSPDEVAAIQSISFYVPKKSVAADENVRRLLGMRVRFDRGQSQRKKYIGHVEKNSYGLPMDWADSDVVEFKVNGRAGERITEVAATSDLQSIRLHTNQGRSVIAGDSGKSDWQTIAAGDERMITGLCVAFISNDDMVAMVSDLLISSPLFQNVKIKR